MFSKAQQPQQTPSTKATTPFFKPETTFKSLANETQAVTERAPESVMQMSIATHTSGKSQTSSVLNTPSNFKHQTSNLPIQAKLTVGQPNDKYEQEADAMADKVVQRWAMPRAVTTMPTITPFNINAVQRVCAACEKEDKEHIQRKESGEMTASPSVESRLSATKGGGSPLSESTRSEMGTAIGADFSNVRVHTGGEAVQLSQDLSAHAFTHGSDVYFNSGKFSPDTEGGRHLLAHELTHTVQQGRDVKRMIQRREYTASGLQLLLGRRPSPQDWYFQDRMEWQRLSVAGALNQLSPSNTFMRAAFDNTVNNRPNEYQNIQQRHDYYDVISYVIQYDPNTPAAIRGIRFFDAATVVTGSPGIGTVDSPAGAVLLQQPTRVILREVNALLFAANMLVIKDLLTGTRTPQNPNNPTQTLTPFDFDLQMVEYEQTAVESYIQQNQARFTTAVTGDINDTLNLNALMRYFNPNQTAINWAKQSLSVPNLDFTIRRHRVAIGRADVFLFHKQTQAQYLAYMIAHP